MPCCPSQFWKRISPLDPVLFSSTLPPGLRLGERGLCCHAGMGWATEEMDTVNMKRGGGPNWKDQRFRFSGRQSCLLTRGHWWYLIYVVPPVQSLGALQWTGLLMSVSRIVGIGSSLIQNPSLAWKDFRWPCRFSSRHLVPTLVSYSRHVVHKFHNQRKMQLAPQSFLSHREPWRMNSIHGEGDGSAGQSQSYYPGL